MGTGLLTKHSHIVYDLEDWLKKFRKRSKERSIIIKCHPALAARLKEGSFKSLFKIQLKYFMRIKLVEDETMPIGQVRFYSEKTQKEITEEAR